MKRLGHALTILAVALAPAATRSAFAQSVTVDIPRVEVPAVVVPDVVVPHVVVPQVVIPDVAVPHVEIPRIEIPQIEIPQVEIPQVEIPQVEIPQIEIPRVEIPQIDAFQLDSLQGLDSLRFDLADRLKDARAWADMAEVGRLAQKTLTDDQRAEIAAAREKARDDAERARDSMRDSMKYYALQGPPPVKRLWTHCDNRDADRLYDCGRDALDDKQWDRAVEFFGKVATSKSDRADAALYWKAYAQNKLGQRTEALATIAQFKSAYAKSRWGNDVSALEIDVRQHSGEPVKPGETSDDDLKLLALQALMNNNSPDAVPMLEKILQGPQSPRVKDRALFVLAQTQTPAARAIVVKVAKGGANPDLQSRAVRYLGEINTPESRQALSEVYGTTTDPDMKRNILRSYMVSHDKEHLVAAARQEQDASLRAEAIRQLGNMRADDSLAELYARETSADVKKQIIRSLGNAGNADKLMSLATTEPDAELRRNAIRTLGLLRRTETGPRLTAMYDKEQNVDVRKAVVDALFIQGNAPALVELARKEKNTDLKLELVKKLSTMKDKEAQDYLIELLK